MGVGYSHAFTCSFTQREGLNVSYAHMFVFSGGVCYYKLSLHSAMSAQSAYKTEIIYLILLFFSFSLPFPFHTLFLLSYTHIIFVHTLHTSFGMMRFSGEKIIPLFISTTTNKQTQKKSNNNNKQNLKLDF